MICTECNLRWEPRGGAGGQQIPDCPVCKVAARLSAAEGERDEYRVGYLRVQNELTAERARADAAEARAEQKQTELNAMADKWMAADARVRELEADIRERGTAHPRNGPSAGRAKPVPGGGAGAAGESVAVLGRAVDRSRR